ncbi:O-methyltransferase [Vibrio aerogenes]|uniref:O-methyltransferase n=1 Tax=Vibrio aerogenes TaxID=92172 RepID=UPI0021C36D53|nr:class I SAM-dependent methyltransferase [Vibrio aerogenes]
MKAQKITYPEIYHDLYEATSKLNFTQLSDVHTGTLLSSLCASKHNAMFLELGTGTGLSTCWMLNGMCPDSKLVSVENEEALMNVAREYLNQDPRLTLVLGDGAETIHRLEKNSVDFIFADTWPGKYYHLEQTLDLLVEGGMYVIDDMLPQENWPEGHEEKVNALVDYLAERDDLVCTQINWSTGVIICTKKTNGHSSVS